MGGCRVGCMAGEPAEPLAQIEGHGIHVGLVVAVGQAAAASAAGVVIADEVGDDALDGGAPLQYRL